MPKTRPSDKVQDISDDYRKVGCNFVVAASCIAAIEWLLNRCGHFGHLRGIIVRWSNKSRVWRRY